MIFNDSMAVNLNNIMTTDIKCFQHCKTSERYLCFELPEKCPTCESNLNASIKFKVPPFVVPRPLKLTDTRLKCLPPYSLLLQPTDCNYRRLALEPDLSDLHIGVTNSDSDVFDFNQNGLNKNAHNWIDTPSIVIEIKSEDDQRGTEDENSNKSDFKWNTILDRHWKRRKELWNRCFYDENRFNCLDFVITFLLEYGLFDMSREIAACKKHIQHHPQLRLAGGLLTGGELMSAHSFGGSPRNLFVVKSLLKRKISKEFIQPEFDKCLRYLNLIISLYEKKYLVEKLDS